MISHFYCLPIFFCEKSHLNGSGSSYPCDLVLFCSEARLDSTMVHGCPTLISVFTYCNATCEKIRGRKGFPLSQKGGTTQNQNTVFFLSSLSWRPGLPQIFFRLQTLLRTWGKTWIGKNLGYRKERKSKKEGVEYTGSKEKIINRKGG